MERIYHTWDKWECYPAGLYENKPEGSGRTDDELRDDYAEFLRDDGKFREALEGVLQNWPNSTEHYLSNERMNRIAWLGQAAACYALRLPRVYRGGFNRLTDAEQETANRTALEYLNRWLADYGEPTLTMDQAQSKTEMDLY